MLGRMSRTTYALVREFTMLEYEDAARIADVSRRLTTTPPDSQNAICNVASTHTPAADTADSVVVILRDPPEWLDGSVDPSSESRSSVNVSEPSANRSNLMTIESSRATRSDLRKAMAERARASSEYDQWMNKCRLEAVSSERLRAGAGRERQHAFGRLSGLSAAMAPFFDVDAFELRTIIVDALVQELGRVFLSIVVPYATSNLCCASNSSFSEMCRSGMSFE